MDMDFDELYKQEFRKTYQYIRYMVSNSQVAEDLTQDTFVRIYKTDLTCWKWKGTNSYLLSCYFLFGLSWRNIKNEIAWSFI